VGGNRIPAFEHLLRRVGHIGAFVIGALEVDHVLDRVEGHDGNELDLVAGIAAQELDLAVPGDRFCLDSRKHVIVQQTLIDVGVVGCRPAVPNAFDGHDHSPWGLRSFHR
jgi:hypothetical protein